jgi:hypothetical protein
MILLNQPGMSRDSTGPRIPAAMTTEVAPNPKKSAGMRRIRLLSLVYTGGRIATHGVWSLDRKPFSIGRELLEGDTKASRQHAEIRWERSGDAQRILDRGSKNGIFVGGHQVESALLSNGSVIRIGGSLLVYSEIEVPAGLPLPEPEHGVALGRALAEACADLAAPAEMPILITGPTGAGKELMARRIHEKSGRKGPLVAVNCATLSRELIGSELFGHAAGAFSGATGSRAGLFSTAQGGTLFLDEIGELPLDQQPALLRALQERKVRPIGADSEIEVDVRVVSATHQRLDEGTFRSDLHARLSGFVIELAPLAARKEEVLALFARFCDRQPAIDAAEALLLYDWPQNVRELKNAAERFALVGLPPAIMSAKGQRPPAGPVEAEPTKEELLALVREHGGNVAELSRLLGKHRQQIYRWLEKHGIDPNEHR